MKLPLLITLTLLPCLALAQTTTSTPPPSDSGQKQWHHHRHGPGQELKFLTAKLSLSDIQQGQIKSLLVSRDTQLKAIFGNTGLTKEQKHAQIKALLESTNQQLIQLLNPAQVPIFESLRQHHGKPTA